MTGWDLLVGAALSGGAGVVVLLAGRAACRPSRTTPDTRAAETELLAVIEHGPAGTVVVRAGSLEPLRSEQEFGVLAASRPALVTVGQSLERQVLVDLAVVGHLGLDGDRGQVDAWLSRAWSELRWPAEQGELDVRTVECPDALPAARPAAWADVPILASASRAAGRDLVVLAWTPRPHGLDLAGASYCAPGAATNWALHLGAEATVLEPLGLALEPIQPVEADDSAPPPNLAVRVLGPVEVDGTPDLTDQGAQLVAYLATHTGVTEEQLRTALWPDTLRSRSRFNNLISETRRALGNATDGAPWLAFASRGRYCLHPDVDCDFRRLEDAARNAAADPVQALELVRGRAFDGWTQVTWVFEEALVARAEAMATELAHRAARQGLERGDAEGAARAVAQALRLVADPSLISAATGTMVTSGVG